jgi:uncharacterized cupin superfamily protein
MNPAVIRRGSTRRIEVAYAGQTIYNPVTHERITFRRTTKGPADVLAFDCRVTPGGVSLPAHVHAAQEERFQVISGTLGVMLGGKKQKLYPGDSIVLPAKIKHAWWNAGEFEVRFQVEVDPARNLETVLEAAAGMAAAGKLGKHGMPRNPFRLALMGKLSDTYMRGVPVWMQKIGLTMACAFARALGYDPTFRAYVAAATAPAAAAAETSAA